MTGRVNRLKLKQALGESAENLRISRELRETAEVIPWAMAEDGSYTAKIVAFVDARDHEDKPIDPQSLAIRDTSEPLELAVPVKIDALRVRALVQQGVDLLQKERMDSVAQGVLFLANVVRTLRENAAKFDCTIRLVARPGDDQPSPATPGDTGTP